MIECALDCGVDRNELYTGKYAKNYLDNNLVIQKDLVHLWRIVELLILKIQKHL